MCEGCEFDVVLDLGEQCVASVFPESGDADPPRFPLVLIKCSECHLVQLRDTVQGGMMYGTNGYGYRSGLNATMTAHLTELAEDVLGRVRLGDGDVVVDIGSNDATLLKRFPGSCVRVGVDPNGPQFREFYEGAGGVHLVSEYFSYDAVERFGKAKVVCSVAMFYDLPDPKGFVRDVARVLDPEGLWVLEQSYLPMMIEANSFDTVCHEHLEYYCLRQIDWLCRGAGLKIVDVAFNASNGGSFRVFVAHAGSGVHEACAERIARVLEEEEQFAGLDVFCDFEVRVRRVRDDLRFVLGAVRDVGGGGDGCDGGVYLYGASTKGNTLLQYIGAGDFGIAGASERNVAKVGCVTPGTRIPIVSEEAAREAQPGFMLVLPWHFKAEFLERERAYLDGGGRFVFPLPEVQIVGRWKTALITGVTGQLGRHLARVLTGRGYHVYGTSRGGESVDDVCLFEGGLRDRDFLSRVIRIVKPDEIYHLAAVTDRVQTHSHAYDTIIDNGAAVAMLCEVVLEWCPGSKVFVANSVGVFEGIGGGIGEGIGGGVVVDDESIGKAFYPTTLYSVAKVTAYWTTRYFREHFGMFVCSGFISNAESSLRSPRYVTTKIARHDFDVGPLVLDNVNACADWIHASDVSSAMIAILGHDVATDYIVSSGKTHSVRDFVEMVLKHRGVYRTSEAGGGVYVDTETGRVLVETRNVVKAYDRRVSFKNDKLRSLGWEVKYHLEDIVEEMIGDGGA